MKNKITRRVVAELLAPLKVKSRQIWGGMKDYFLRVAAWLSQGAHCLVLGGHHDMTVSARCHVEYRLKGNARWRIAHDAIDRLFLRLIGQHDHCRQSFETDKAFARQVLSLTHQPVSQKAAP